MLKLYFPNDDIPGDVYWDAEELFSKTKLDGSEIDKILIKEIDGGSYLSPTHFIDRFGATLNLDLLSMGCKIALAVHHNPDKVCNAIEAGYNAINAIMKCCRDGAIIIYDMEYIVNTRGIDAIDICYKGYRFTSIQRFADYMHNEWPDDPELDGGVEPCL